MFAATRRAPSQRRDGGVPLRLQIDRDLLRRAPSARGWWRIARLRARGCDAKSKTGKRHAEAERVILHAGRQAVDAAENRRRWSPRRCRARRRSPADRSAGIGRSSACSCALRLLDGGVLLDGDRDWRRRRAAAASCSGGSCSSAGAAIAICAGSPPVKLRDRGARDRPRPARAWINCVRAAASSASAREASAPGRSSRVHQRADRARDGLGAVHAGLRGAHGLLRGGQRQVRVGGGDGDFVLGALERGLGLGARRPRRRRRWRGAGRNRRAPR